MPFRLIDAPELLALFAVLAFLSHAPGQSSNAGVDRAVEDVVGGGDALTSGL